MGGGFTFKGHIVLASLEQMEHLVALVPPCSLAVGGDVCIAVWFPGLTHVSWALRHLSIVPYCLTATVPRGIICLAPHWHLSLQLQF